MQSTNNGIHCKVQYGNEYRRFLYQNTHFDSLLTQVKRLFTFPEDANVVIKYKDEEGDMVTISSNEELVFAIELFAGSVLRLVAIDQNRRCGGKRWGCPTVENGPHPFAHPGFHAGGPHPFGGHPGFQGHPGFHGHPGFEGQKHWKRGCKKEGKEKCREKWIQKLKENPELVQKKIDKMTQKRDFLTNTLEWMQNNSNNNPKAFHRQKHLQFKLKKVEHRLSFLQNFKQQASEPAQQQNQNQPPIEKPIQASPNSNLDSLQEFLPGPIRQAKEKREVMVKAISDAHVEVLLKKNEIQAARLQGRAGTPKSEVQQRIMAIKEELWTLRNKQQERKAELQAHDAYIKNLRAQNQELKHKK